MADNEGLRGVMSDGLESLKLVSFLLEGGVTRLTLWMKVARLSWQRNVTAWVFVPIGILIILLACFGVQSLIGLSTVTFPASVAVLVLLFFGLVILELVLGDRKTRALVKVIDIPVSSSGKIVVTKVI